MGFSITSAVFGGFIIIFYSMGIHGFRHRYDRRTYGTQMLLMALILILGIVEFAIGIWAAVCLCRMKPCTCCYSTPPRQVSSMMYTVNCGYTRNPFPVGASTASPMQAVGGMVAVHTTTPGLQQVQPQMVMMPVSEAGPGMFTPKNVTPGSVGSPPQVVMVPVVRRINYPPQAPTNVLTATAYQPRQSEML